MPPRKDDRRSPCPIAFALDIFGDRWTLLVIRDLAFAKKRHFREFLDSPEKIASNILSDRLQRLEQAGVVSRQPDPDDARQAIYQLTEKGKDLIPALLELMRWGAKYDSRSGTPKNVIRRIKDDRETLIEEIRAGLK